MPVTHEEIAALAFRLWKDRGEPMGSPEVDWERAEATLQLKAMNLVKTRLSSDLGEGVQQPRSHSAEPPSVQPPASVPKPEQPRARKTKTAAGRPQPR